MPTIIALAGPMGSGKTTLANLLCAQQPYIRLKFATPIKNMIRSLLRDTGIQHGDIDRMLDGDLKDEPTDSLCGRTPRHALQTLGTEWRNMIHPVLWTNLLDMKITQSTRNIVIDDMRFIHEAEMLKQHGALLVKIIRPNITTSPHASENEWTKIHEDLFIANIRDPQYMLTKLNEHLESKR